MTDSASNPNEPLKRDNVIRVAADSQPTAVAGAIAKQIRQSRSAAAQAIGVNAVNKMLKAAIIAGSYLHEDNLSLLMRPSFTEVEIDGRRLTAIHLRIQPCESITTEV
ncbi:stage V sporulation protein S [bacterium]|nr:stage V sporulation protein S [bacterium]